MSFHIIQYFLSASIIEWTDHSSTICSMCLRALHIHYHANHPGVYETTLVVVAVRLINLGISEQKKNYNTSIAHSANIIAMLLLLLLMMMTMTMMVMLLLLRNRIYNTITSLFYPVSAQIQMAYSKFIHIIPETHSEYNTYTIILVRERRASEPQVERRNYQATTHILAVFTLHKPRNHCDLCLQHRLFWYFLLSRLSRLSRRFLSSHYVFSLTLFVFSFSRLFSVQLSSSIPSLPPPPSFSAARLLFPSSNFVCSFFRLRWFFLLYAHFERVSNRSQSKRTLF